MPNIGWMEIGVVIVLALLIFGPKRLPELGSSVGKAITGFKKGLKEGEDELRKAVAEGSESPEISEARAEDPVEAKAPEKAESR